MLLMTAINLEGLECNWRIKVTVSGELQQDFHSLFFNGTENGRRRTRFAHSIVGDNGSLNPRTTQKNLSQPQRNISLKNCKNISPESQNNRDFSVFWQRTHYLLANKMLCDNWTTICNFPIMQREVGNMELKIQF